MPLVAEAATSVRQQLPGGNLDRQLAPARPYDLSANTDPVPERETAELLEVRSQLLEGEQLDAPGPVPQLAEGELALGARPHEAPGGGNSHSGLLADLEMAKGSGDVARS